MHAHFQRPCNKNVKLKILKGKLKSIRFSIIYQFLNFDFRFSSFIFKFI